MARRNYHHGELRAALLDAAEALVRERGADGWSLREASARVGVSSSAAYHHFASRDALVRALRQRVLGELGERLGQEVGRTAGPEAGADHQWRLVAVGRTYVQWAVEDPSVARLAFGAGAPATGDPASDSTSDSTSDAATPPHPHDVLDAELDRLVEVGGLPAAARPGADFVVWAAVHGLATLLVDGLARLDDPRAVAREAERVVRAVLTGLTHEAVPSQGWPTPHSAHTERRTGRGADK
ncbi:TetR/AcrR family transcriptional regulator [Streptomyces niveus]|uniref:TetR/AcrR family transcriptional regulator n=1 Tax=Streptomyces niveus TaxID=193462 RepID=A0ABZ1ZVW0_STRNV|nr:TetR/AcrR family transcriptional regulator [Streptomyces niveus]